MGGPWQTTFRSKVEARYQLLLGLFEAIRKLKYKSMKSVNKKICCFLSTKMYLKIPLSNKILDNNYFIIYMPLLKIILNARHCLMNNTCKLLCESFGQSWTWLFNSHVVSSISAREWFRLWQHCFVWSSHNRIRKKTIKNHPQNTTRRMNPTTTEWMCIYICILRLDTCFIMRVHIYTYTYEPCITFTQFGTLMYFMNEVPIFEPSQKIVLLDTYIYISINYHEPLMIIVCVWNYMCDTKLRMLLSLSFYAIRWRKYDVFLKWRKYALAPMTIHTSV